MLKQYIPKIMCLWLPQPLINCFPVVMVTLIWTHLTRRFQVLAQLSTVKNHNDYQFTVQVAKPNVQSSGGK